MDAAERIRELEVALADAKDQAIRDRTDLFSAGERVRILEDALVARDAGDARTASAAFEAMIRRPPPQTTREIQAEQYAWAIHNFGLVPPWQPLLGVLEELGELAHAYLKKAQGIRGTSAEHDARQRDAVGDLAIFLFHFCALSGWDFTEIVAETWAVVRKRDWKKNPMNAAEVAGE